MRLIVCLDDNNGMAFNRRRQSRDREVIADILDTIGDKKLYMSGYSSTLFPDDCPQVCVSDNFLSEAGEDDYCFVELENPSSVQDSVTELIIYRWNREYPADVRFDMTLPDLDYFVSEDIKGYSHEKIRKEVHQK